jgi:hypothetical protein
MCPTGNARSTFEKKEHAWTTVSKIGNIVPRGTLRAQSYSKLIGLFSLSLSFFFAFFRRRLSLSKFLAFAISLLDSPGLLILSS